MLIKLQKLSLVILLLGITKIGLTGSYLNDIKEISDNTISASCWVAPSIPELVYPPDNTISGAGSPWDLNPYMDWNNSTTSCPLTTTLTYQYQACTSPACSTTIYTSSWLTNSQIPASGTPNGVYYWHVRARDNHGNISAFSPTRKLVVDRIAPSVPTLSITGSYTKSITEKINSANWTTAGQISVLSTDTITNPDTTITSLSGSMFRIGSPDDPGNYVWENRLMQSFATGAKSLSLQYNFFSRDYPPFDSPGFFIRLNGQEIFNQNSLNGDEVNADSTGWQHFYYDLSSQNNFQTNLAIYAGNTGGNTIQSWAYLDQITTYFVSAPLHAQYQFAGSDNAGGSGLNHFSYSLDNSNWTNIGIGSSFTIPTSGSFDLWYYSVDLAGNHSPILQVKIIVDNDSPSATTLGARDTTQNSTTLVWSAPGNDGDNNRASKYDLRYAKAIGVTDCTAFDFSSAASLNPPPPHDPGFVETLLVTALDPDSLYCFALQTIDEAPNYSPLSNVLAVTTNSSAAVINPGDLIINELLWSGIDPEAQFLELRNLTNRTLPLDGLLLTIQNAGSEVPLAIDFSGRSIPPQGFFLIAKSTAFLSPSVTPDIITSALDLSPVNLAINLYLNDTLLDLAGDGGIPFEGTGQYSMERTTTPGVGNNPLNWYTCIDPATNSLFVGPDYRGTPALPNRSENEPIPDSSDSPPRPTTTPTPLPVFSLDTSYNPITHQITIRLINPPIDHFDYELTYTSATLDKGIAGVAHLDPVILYLGTCTTNGNCTPDPDLGPTATLVLGDITQTISLQ